MTTWGARVSRPNRSAEPQPLGQALERLFGHLGAPAVQTVSDLGSQWPDIVGPGLADHSRPAGLVDGVLTVVCDDPAWASQIKWMDAQIKTQISERFVGTELRVIRTTTRS